MTTEYKTVIKKVKKTVMVDEKIARTVHTLQDNSERQGIVTYDHLPEHQIIRCDRLASDIAGFSWLHTAEGYTFWRDVALRLRRLGNTAKP